MPYPTGTDLADYLVSIGVIDSVPGDLTRYNEIMEAAWQGFEKDTNWAPFLNEDDEPETKYYDPNGGNQLVIPEGIIVLDSVTVNDVEKTEGTDYWLKPANSTPKTVIQFRSCISGLPNTIEVSAQYGYTDTLPSLVKNGLLAKGAVDATADAQGTSGDYVSIKQGPVELKRATGDDQESTLSGKWMEKYNYLVERYVKRRVY